MEIDSEHEDKGGNCKMTVDSLVKFFKDNIDEIKKPESLLKFKEGEIPILEIAGDVRLE